MNKTWEVTKLLLPLQFILIVGMVLAMWFLEGLTVWILQALDRSLETPIIIEVANMTSYMFFLLGLSNFFITYKRYLVHGLTRKTILQAYIIGTAISVFLYTVLMGCALFLSNLDITTSHSFYYLIELFFSGFISFLLGSILIFSFYRSKKLGFLLLVPVLIGLIIKVYIWLGFAIMNPLLSSADFSIEKSVFASLLFSVFLYFILKRISKQMAIKI